MKKYNIDDKAINDQFTELIKSLSTRIIYHNLNLIDHSIFNDSKSKVDGFSYPKRFHQIHNYFIENRA